ncbi:MAG TPA: PAS domain-containing protein [Verrucomicrobiae bacterium]|nr:PAS domain-containing protein [Verrucomicrobiae bacterium]
MAETVYSRAKFSWFNRGRSKPGVTDGNKGVGISQLASENRSGAGQVVLLPRAPAQRGTAWSIISAICFILACSTAKGAPSASPRRVLVIHSFGSVSPQSTTRAIAFETELTEHLEEKLDLDEVSLDHSRYAGADMEEALVQYLEKRQARWRPDLVVPIGSPACLFVEKYRDRLFPQTPVIYTGMDRRHLEADALKNNAAYVGENFNSTRFVEDNLRLAPDTTNIVCVIGCSQMEQYWTGALQRDFAQFTNRVSFTWLNNLSFDQVLERVGKLPPHSFIFLFLLMRDATDVSHNADEALKRISEVANAPINGVYEEQMGLGIVGGRLFRPQLEGEEAARLAVRILHGESASSLPPEVIPPTVPLYDWRQLHRWGISEDQLPLGSVVIHRLPSVWQRHKYLIITSVSLVLVQTGLIVGLLFNLGRRRRAERFLRESEERMKLAAGAAALEMWEWSLAGNKTSANGNRSAIAPGKNGDSDYVRYLRTVYSEDRDGVAHSMVKATTGDGNYEHVHRQVLADGRVRWIAARGRVEFDAQHKPVKLRGVALDITARKLAEEQARESERKFLLIANSAPVLIWTSGPDKKCTFFNQPWLDFRGRALEEELGDGWAEGVHAEDMANCLKIYHESFDARLPFTMEYRLRRYDGKYRWISDRGVPRYGAQNQFMGYIGSCVDVTERKEAEAEAQRSQQELAHVSRVSTLGALAGSLAHELRQPLAAIVVSAEAARRLMDVPHHQNDEEVLDALDDIAQQGRRAGGIIAEMRAMLKKDPGQMAAENMNLVVKAVLEMVRNDLMTGRVMLVLRLDPFLPLVYGHAVQLQQVVLNLVMNACDAMSEEPVGQRTLTVESRRVAGNEIEISVVDTGPGFSEEMFLNAFEPFRTTKAKGLGLGLAICRSIITAHGGRFQVANNGDKGAVIRFTLPAQNEIGV